MLNICRIFFCFLRFSLYLCNMTKQEIKLQTKLTALNAIRKICNGNFKYSNYPDDESYAEQRESAIRDIIRNLERDLINLK